jgi:hypothetical protein
VLAVYAGAVEEALKLLLSVRRRRLEAAARKTRAAAANAAFAFGGR